MADAKLVVANVGRNLAVSGAKAEATFDFAFIPAKDAIIASAETIRQHKA